METPKMIFDKFTDAGKNLTEKKIIEAIQYALEAGELPVRPAVKWFAERMEQTLRRNDHKGGWKECGLQYLSMRLTQERKELTDALLNKDAERIINESTDIANFALMISDKFGNNYGG